MNAVLLPHHFTVIMLQISPNSSLKEAAVCFEILAETETVIAVPVLELQ